MTTDQIIKDKRYPKCSKLGVLRKRGKYLMVSTTALKNAVGWRTYQKYLPHMRYRLSAGPTPDSCEKFLKKL